MKKFLIMFLILFIFGCGQENENDKNINQIEKITNENMIFSIGDFKSIGYKVNKEYDVSELSLIHI